jgi:hypothetical protein
MRTPLESPTPNEPASGERSKKEMLKLVHKLRWAGMDEEAERLLRTLQHAQAGGRQSDGDPGRDRLERDGFKLNRHRALDLWWSMIFSENGIHFSG